MPIFSLPSNNGIGTLGKGAFDFIRFLKKSGQKYWQILPICPPAKENSPYLSYSARAGNPLLIDIDWLVGDGWLTEEEVEYSYVKKSRIYKKDSWIESGRIDYKQVTYSRSKIFSYLYKNFFSKVPDDYMEFCEKHSDWLDDYSLFMTLLEYHDFKELPQWEDKYKFRDENALEQFKNEHISTVKYYQMLQYFFYTQWECLHEYANNNNIKIIGDIPLYVSLTSSDAWVDPNIFKIDKDYNVSILSGCPANKSARKDATGQIWDSPVYNWDYLKKTEYKWWINRLNDALSLYDIIRIDHFKGFESYYNINAKTRDANNGVWEKGPGLEFWKHITEKFNKNSIDELPVFAEDLGIITPELEELLKQCGFAGMCVIQYGFNRKKEFYLKENIKENKNRYLPHNYKKNSVAYVSTHDTHTLDGWINHTQHEVLENAKLYYDTKNLDELFDKIINSVISSNANTCILSTQDLLKLGNDSKINTPGTVGDNWIWQMTYDEFDKLDANELYRLTEESERL